MTFDLPTHTQHTLICQHSLVLHISGHGQCLLQEVLLLQEMSHSRPLVLRDSGQYLETPKMHINKNILSCHVTKFCIRVLLNKTNVTGNRTYDE